MAESMPQRGFNQSKNILKLLISANIRIIFRLSAVFFVFLQSFREIQ